MEYRINVAVKVQAPPWGERYTHLFYATTKERAAIRPIVAGLLRGFSDVRVTVAYVTETARAADLDGEVLGPNQDPADVIIEQLNSRMEAIGDSIMAHIEPKRRRP